MDDIELDLPTVISGEGGKQVLEIAGIGLRNPLPVDGEDTYAYIRGTDGIDRRLPESLRGWATETLAAHYDLRAAGLPSIFPRRIEFGIRDGATYARPVPTVAG